MKIMCEYLAQSILICTFVSTKGDKPPLCKTDKMKVQEMTQSEFTEAFKNAEDHELVADNIRKRWSIEEGGYWYVANAGDCDGGDVINFWFESDVDGNGYVKELGARI